MHNQTEQQGQQKKGKNKKKWAAKKIAVATQEAGPPTKHCKHCDKKGHTGDECWKLHPKKRPKHFDKEGKKKALLAVDAEQRVDNT